MKIEISDRPYIVAVSGGVDSVVLLDVLAHRKPENLTVAHFDHGTREDSAYDEEFVAGLATKYGLPYISRREELGVGVSEARARERRYAFLRGVAQERGAKIITAHHADDVIETIAINLHRGTGWRGLAVLDSHDIVRPLLGWYKAELIEYAHTHKLTWHEDSTNSDDMYLRNRLRVKLRMLDEDTKRQLLALHSHQAQLKIVIDTELKQYSTEPYSRYFFTMIPETVAHELIRSICYHESGRTPLTTQKRRALLAIKTALPGARCDIGEGVYLEFTRSYFIVKTSGK